MTKPRARDRLAVAGFVILWLVPVAYRGLAHRAPPLMPRALRELTNISCLFSRASPTWSAFYVQVRAREGGPWSTLDERELFGLEPFGHRTRMHRYLIRWQAGNQPALRELAQFIADRQASVPVAVRFLAATIPVRAEDPPSGAWHKPPLRSVAQNHVRVLGEFVTGAQP